MEGSMFYWILWSFWVYLTFMMSKQNPIRLKLSAAILIVIILSGVHFTVGNFHIYAGGLFLLVLSYIILSKEKNGPLLYFVMCSIIVTIAYVTFHLFEIFDPVWIIFKREWMIGIGFGYLSILLQKTLKGRLLIVVIGTMQGEILYAFFLNKFQFSYPIGTFAFLDVCSLISLLLVGWSCFENAGTIFQTHVNFLDKGKQKSS